MLDSSPREAGGDFCGEKTTRQSTHVTKNLLLVYKQFTLCKYAK
jgi:hypothetical protein